MSGLIRHNLGVSAKINGGNNLEYARRYYAANREAVIANCKKQMRKKRALRSVPGGEGFYRKLVDSLIRQRDGDMCWICDTYVDEKSSSIDHVILMRAGGHNSADNVKLAHLLCNLQRPKGKRFN